ncbi:TRAP transporter small permease [Brucella anthropi]|jgi:TRAP-type transport system small permease protein|uniref:TRAP transporter small permease protein n=1 Tax=Brucella anthropi TaxID=529 RepID=A0A011TFU4_BRUAN|nr:TRAP transporter small permease [Brucella anthropi]EXL02777.1 C4-dicarboxylate ABC transporter substrate-binding protein [Brucella anthropi]KAB2762988.1 TRAP transporter small permease [Brucella anthropi]KIU70311.1 C4-dicarboxylate ABC transporter substrate-binding protein [Brucella anthropi]UVV69906.1 TRAP transporter small permease [Brucella anthropi]
MTKLFKGLEGICRLLILAAFLLLMGAVLLQVYARTFLSSAPVWTEELTRFCLLYIGALGAGLALRSGDMVNVDLLCESLPGRMPWLLRLVSAALTVAFAAILLPAAWDYTMIGSRQTAPSLGWRMDFVHATQIILLVALGLWALMRIIEMLSGRHDGRPIPNSEEN